MSRRAVGTRISPNDQEKLYEQATKLGDDPEVRELHRSKAKAMAESLGSSASSPSDAASKGAQA